MTRAEALAEARRRWGHLDPCPDTNERNRYIGGCYARDGGGGDYFTRFQVGTICGSSPYGFGASWEAAFAGAARRAGGAPQGAAPGAAGGEDMSESEWKVTQEAGVGSSVCLDSAAGHSCIASIHHARDAALISAAPDLLEALDDLLFVIETDPTADWTGPRARARSALAKARGEE